jgi:hypothetical protein
MSSKIRVLVEGKDDRGHILNLLNLLAPKVRLKVDIAVDILGDCKLTASNNRAKIEKIHGQCKGNESYRRLFFLCDREFRNFVIGGLVEDKSVDHEVDGNMSWTLGHSIENYFLSPHMLSEGAAAETECNTHPCGKVLRCHITNSVLKNAPRFKWVSYMA